MSMPSLLVGGVDPWFMHKAGWRERVGPPMSIVIARPFQIAKLEGMSGVIGATQWPYICIICSR